MRKESCLVDAPFNPIMCIIPPHMARHILANGTPAQRDTTRRTVTVSSQIRSRRQVYEEPQPAQIMSFAEGKHRVVYSADSGDGLPGRLMREEGGTPTGDPAVDEAYDGAGATYDLYQEVYQRNSLDNLGLRLVGTVHYKQGYDNAFWDGRQMVYGDGDEDLPQAERLFNRFTIAIDVIGHELTHGVTQFEASLPYHGQPGALNESISDVFGSLVKQRGLNQTASQADWLIGDNLLTPNVNGMALRSLKAPGTAYDDPVLGKDPQPAHMRDFVQTAEDNGGVHINSGIPNHAFYATALEIGGYAWEKAGRIWYATLRDELNVESDFQHAADMTYLVAGNLFGEGSLEQRAVRLGWGEVGIVIGARSRQTKGCLAAPVAWIRSRFASNMPKG
jgi:Zn-dependent metalloprotease